MSYSRPVESTPLLCCSGSASQRSGQASTRLSSSSVLRANTGIPTIAVRVAEIRASSMGRPTRRYSPWRGGFQHVDDAWRADCPSIGRRSVPHECRTSIGTSRRPRPDTGGAPERTRTWPTRLGRAVRACRRLSSYRELFGSLDATVLICGPNRRRGIQSCWLRSGVETLVRCACCTNDTHHGCRRG